MTMKDDALELRDAYLTLDHLNKLAQSRRRDYLIAEVTEFLNAIPSKGPSLLEQLTVERKKVESLTRELVQADDLLNTVENIESFGYVHRFRSWWYRSRQRAEQKL